MEWWLYRPKERTGRLERFILQFAYLKSIGELPAWWKYPREYNRQRDRDYLNEYLWKSEILLNYYRKLRLSKKRPAWGHISDKFRTTRGYRTALSSYSRTVSRLKDKGFINIIVRKRSSPFRIGSRTVRAIELTEEGKTRISRDLGFNVNT